MACFLVGRGGGKEVPSSPAGLKWNTEPMKFLGVYVGNDCAPLSHWKLEKNSWWLNLHFLCFADQFTKKNLIDFIWGGSHWIRAIILCRPVDEGVLIDICSCLTATLLHSLIVLVYFCLKMSFLFQFFCKCVIVHP